VGRRARAPRARSTGPPATVAQVSNRGRSVTCIFLEGARTSVALCVYDVRYRVFSMIHLVGDSFYASERPPREFEPGSSDWDRAQLSTRASPYPVTCIFRVSANARRRTAGQTGGSVTCRTAMELSEGRRTRAEWVDGELTTDRLVTQLNIV
jgi:hypothetical protein